MVTSNPLVEIRAAYKALANDPPNGITTMRALKALASAIEEIQTLQIECMRRGARGISSGDETAGYREAFYQIGDLLGLAAMPISPKEAFEERMLPRLRQLIGAVDTCETSGACPHCGLRDADRAGYKS